MIENNKNEAIEIESVCLLTMITMNLLLLLSIGVMIWSVNAVLTNTNFLKAFEYNGFLQ